MARERPLEDNAAIVTGASAGIGRATARALARDGADVTLAARRTDRLREIADEITEKHGVEARVATTDVTDYDQVERMVTTAVVLYRRS